jgi:hypothetical protein
MKPLLNNVFFVFIIRVESVRINKNISFILVDSDFAET